MKYANTLSVTPVALLFSSLALAGPINLTVDPARSSLDMAITVDIGVASDTDVDSSTLSGMVEIELDDAGNPTQITLNDLMVFVDQTMSFNWSFGFFGSADATMTNASVSYATPGIPAGPVPVSGGAFGFLDTPVDLGGMMNVNYNILLAGSGSNTINLADQGTVFAVFSGGVTIVGDQITVTSSLPLDTILPLLDGNGTQVGTVTTTGTATIVATGVAPPCPADLTGDGVLNFFDVSAFLTAFSQMDPVADFNNDGAFNFFDVSLFLQAFTGGCP